MDAVFKITAAGESATAGVAKLEVVAEPAIPADQVTFVSGPTGWAVGPGGSSGGFTLSGPAIAKGEDAVVSLKVKALPDVPQLTFKVVQTYSDSSLLVACRPGKLDGRPDLSHRACASTQVTHALQFWHCTADFDVAYATR